MRGGLIRLFREDEETKNGKSLVDFCAERAMCVMNIFHHMGIDKYKWNALRDNA